MLKTAVKVFVIGGVLIAGGGCGPKPASPVRTGEEWRAEGMRKMDAGDAAGAREAFENMMAASGTSAAEGLYWVGMTYYRQRLYDEAYVRFQQLVDRYPASEWCDDAQYMMGRAKLDDLRPLYQDQTSVDEALDAFLTLIEEYESSDLVPLAEEGIEACLRLRAEKLMQVGRFYRKTGKYRAAAIYFSGLAEDYPTWEGVPEALFLAGECYEKAGAVPEARSQYEALRAKYGNTVYGNLAAERLRALTH